MNRRKISFPAAARSCRRKTGRHSLSYKKKTVAKRIITRVKRVCPLKVGGKGGCEKLFVFGIWQLKIANGFPKAKNILRYLFGQR